MPAAARKTHNLKLTKLKETKGAVRYVEDGKEDAHRVGTFYLRKSALNGEIPQKLQVTIKF